MNKNRLLLFVVIVIAIIIVIWAVCALRKVCIDHLSKPAERTVHVDTDKPAKTRDDKRQESPRQSCRLILTSSSTWNEEGPSTPSLRWILNNSYIYFDNDRARKFIESEYGHRVVSAYDELIPGAYKQICFDIVIFYKKGGIYIDTGMTALNHLESL